MRLAPRRRGRLSIRHADTPRIWRTRAPPSGREYIIRVRCREKKKEREGEGGGEKQNSSNRGPFSWRDGRVLTERPNREHIPHIPRGNNITRFHDTMFNSNYNFNFNYSRFEIDASDDK